MAQAGIMRPHDLPHREEVKAVLQRFGVRRARLFGSAARGELTPGSDIDILVELPGAVDYAVLLRLSDELEQVTGHRIDLLTSIKPVFRPYIEPDLVEIPL